MKRHHHAILLRQSLLFLCTLLVSYGAVAATHYTQFGRYLTVTMASPHSDRYELSTIIVRQFPASIKTRGQAIRDTLKATGYQLLSDQKTCANVVQLYHQPLPDDLKKIGPMPLKQALLQLSGHVYQLVVDPVHRLITYKLRQSYRTL